MALCLGWGGAGPRVQVHGEANLWEGPVTLWTLLSPCCIQQQARLPFPTLQGPWSQGPWPPLGGILPGLSWVHCVPSIQYGPSHREGWHLPGSPVVRTQHFTALGPGSVPGGGTKILWTLHPKCAVWAPPQENQQRRCSVMAVKWPDLALTWRADIALPGFLLLCPPPPEPLPPPEGLWAPHQLLLTAHPARYRHLPRWVN